MGITKCNTMDAIQVLGSQCPDCFRGDEVSANPFTSKAIFHLLSTNDM